MHCIVCELLILLVYAMRGTADGLLFAFFLLPIPVQDQDVPKGAREPFLPGANVVRVKASDVDLLKAHLSALVAVRDAKGILYTLALLHGCHKSIPGVFAGIDLCEFQDCLSALLRSKNIVQLDVWAWSTH